MSMLDDLSYIVGRPSDPASEEAHIQADDVLG